jgi:hypothetical protein
MLCKPVRSVNEQASLETYSFDSDLARQCESNAIAAPATLLLDTNFRQGIRCVSLIATNF